MSKINYDVKEGFCAPDDSHLPKPKKRDWKQLEPVAHAGDASTIDLYHNEVTGYYMSEHNDGTKILGRNMTQLQERINRKYGA